MKVNQIEGTSAQSKWHFFHPPHRVPHLEQLLLEGRRKGGCWRGVAQKNANLLAFNLKEKQKQTKKKKKARRDENCPHSRHKDPERSSGTQRPRNSRAPEHQNTRTPEHRDSTEQTLIMCTKLGNNNRSGPQQQMRHINERIMSSVELPAMDGWSVGLGSGMDGWMDGMGCDGSRAKSHLMPKNTLGIKREEFRQTKTLFIEIHLLTVIKVIHFKLRQWLNLFKT